MSVVAIVMLGVAGALSAFLWWHIDPRRHAIGAATAVAALTIPVLFLAAAAIFAVTGEQASDLERVMAAILGTISAVTGGGVVATSVLRIADRFAGHPGSPPAPPSIPPPPPPGGASVTPGSLSATGITTTSTTTARPTPAAVAGDVGTTVSNPDTLRGGAWIGALERLAIVATLLARWPEGLAVILAVKGLGRYPELRRPAAAERFIIGTLASALWSITCVGVIVLLTGDPVAG